MTTKHDQMDWRRSKVLELSSKGHSEREIASALQIGKTTAHQDLTFLNKQAKENLRRHIEEVVPSEYQKAMVGIKSNLRQTLEIAETVSDPRVKLQARSIVNERYHSIIDLVTNAGIVSDALSYVEKKKERIDNLHKAADKIDNLTNQTLAEAAKETEETQTGTIIRKAFDTRQGACLSSFWLTAALVNSHLITTKSCCQGNR